jgi:hypothetical protein
MLTRKNIIAMALTIAAAGPSCAQSSYTIVDLGACSPRAINKHGQVTGYRRFSPQDKGDHAFLWNPSTNTFINLGLPNGYTAGAGRGLNNYGDVTGAISATTTGNHSYLWPAAGTAGFVGSATKSIVTSAYAVNDSKEVAGVQNGTGGGAFLSKIVSGKRKLYIIGPGTPSSINTSGQILVNTSSFDYPSGYLWTPSGSPGQGTAASMPTGYVAYALTDSGALAGARIYESVQPWQQQHARRLLPVFRKLAGHSLAAGHSKWQLGLGVGEQRQQQRSRRWFDGSVRLGGLPGGRYGICMG